MQHQLALLKDTLLTLKAAGPNGFEGLLRTTLTKLTGIPFRLASSGLQGGVDGNSASQKDAICFEAKRYDGSVPRTEVLTKIVDLARTNKGADRLWILGATSEIGTQLASAVQEAGDQLAISTLILDWTIEPLPLLAVAIVAADRHAIRFLAVNCEPQPNLRKLAKAFRDISRHADFNSLLHKVQSNLNVSTLATARAIALNKEWRNAAFASQRVARECLGQALSINANPDLPTLRSVLRDRIRGASSSSNAIVLTGGEGYGKSWLAAQICCDHDGFALFISAEQFEGVSPTGIDEHLIDLLIKQSGDVANETLRLRWRHRLSAWKSEPPSSALLVIVDGINQRQSFRWDRILNSLQVRLQAIGGRLMVTVRPPFWEKTVAPGINFKVTKIPVPEWDKHERNQLLKHYDINPDWLDTPTLKTLLNPRLLSVAVSTLPHQDPSAWKGLTTDRILMEHLRASQRENFENETMANLTKRLSSCAEEVLERAQKSATRPSRIFEEDSDAVIETRFFRALPGPGNNYELRDEGLTLALGYALIDQLWQAHHSQLDLAEQIPRLIDPISAMDRTVDVIFSALLVCSLDPIRFDQAIFSVLLDAFSSLQNISDQRYEEFLEIVRNNPEELLGALGRFTLEKGRRLNYDWLKHVAFNISKTEKDWKLIEPIIHRWLRSYNKDAIEQTNRYQKHDEDEYAKRLRENQKRIQNTLSSLSPIEARLLDQMIETSGDTGSLFTLALKLLSGKPIAGFSDSFVMLGLGISLDGGGWSSQKAFQHLTTFNRADREEAEEAFLRSIEPLRSSETSKSGQRTIVRMLHAAGDEDSASEANKITIELQKDINLWQAPSPYEWRQSRIANPDSTIPIDMVDCLRVLDDVPPDALMQTMGQTKEDHDIEQVLPIACRFSPEFASDKARNILLGLISRTSMPLRQLIFNGLDYSPLVTRDMAIEIVNRVANTDMGEVLPEKEQNILRMFLFFYAAPNLTPLEQLQCMTNPAFGSDYLLDVIPCLKPQTVESIIKALQEALDDNNEDAVYGALAAARYGQTTVTPDLELLLLRCQKSDSAKVRTASFAIAIDREIKRLREEHVNSDWSSCSGDKRANESWLGSVLLAEACTRNEISVDEVFSRANPETWFELADRIGESATRPLASLFLRRMQSAIDEATRLKMPVIDITLSTSGPALFPIFDFDETSRINNRFQRQDSIRGLFEKQSDQEERENRLHEIFDSFFNDLKGGNALLLVERLPLDKIRNLALSNKDLIPQILDALESVNHPESSLIRNFLFVIGNIVSKDKPEKAIALFRQAISAHSIVTIDLGDDLTLEHEAIWSSIPSSAMHEFWRQRLLKSGSDEALALEVLAAERFGAAEYIRQFVEDNGNSASTLDKAYAISVAGFSTQSDSFMDVIERHLEDYGITGDAARHAKREQEDSQWARKWIDDLCNSQSTEDLWCHLMISKACMDARSCIDSIKNTQWSPYEPRLRSARNKSIREKNKNRKKTLIGQEAPDDVFVTGF